MALDIQDREWVGAIIEAAGEKMLTVSREIAKEIVTETLALHQAQCPHGKRLSKYRSIAIGICVGSFLTGGGSGLILAKFLNMS